MAMRQAIALGSLLLAAACALAGCASDHDLKRNGYNLAGGGYIDDEIRTGLYSIKGYSNFSMLPGLERDGAAKTFFRRADALCGAGAYTVVNSNLGTYAASVRVTFMAGHVLCANSGMTVAEARSILKLDEPDQAGAH
jgi:hypothetical protein